MKLQRPVFAVSIASDLLPGQRHGSYMAAQRTECVSLPHLLTAVTVRAISSVISASDVADACFFRAH